MIPITIWMAAWNSCKCRLNHFGYRIELEVSHEVIGTISLNCNIG